MTIMTMIMMLARRSYFGTFLILVTLATTFVLFHDSKLLITEKSNQCGDLLKQIKDSISIGIRNELDHLKTNGNLPVIYIITPTYRRPEQIPELTRLSHTLKLVPRIHWLVAEDSNITNDDVVDLLIYTGLPHTYLLTPMPDIYKAPKIKSKPKGVANRNGGIEWVLKHAKDGVLYFADDDNTYDIRLFYEMRWTDKVSMWPVGLVTGAGLSSPIIKDGKFNGWYDGWIGGRKFPVDMAGFALSVRYLHTLKDVRMPYKAGYEEDGFLKSLKIKPEQIEFKADGCTKVYVWHTQTMKNNRADRRILEGKYNDTNLKFLRNYMYIKKLEVKKISTAPTKKMNSTSSKTNTMMRRTIISKT